MRQPGWRSAGGHNLTTRLSRLARHAVTAITVVGLVLASQTTADAYETTGSSATWGHWIRFPSTQWISWTDNYIGYFDRRSYTGFNADKLVWQHGQGGCIGPTNTNDSVTGYVTYYWPGGSRGPIYSAYAQSIGCATHQGAGPWGAAAREVFPNVLFLSTDSYKYAQVCSTWFANDALPNQFGDCRNHNY